MTNTSCRIYAVALLTLTGCVAIREPHTRAAPASDQSVAFKGAVVGVLEPEIAFDENSFTQDVYRSYYTSERQSDAYLLIKRLRSTDLFQEVNYRSRLSSPPDILLLAQPIPPPQGVDGQNWFVTLMFLGIVPVVEFVDRGVYFSTLDQPQTIYCFPWQETTATGWISLILNVFPQWSSSNDTNAYTGSLSSFLIQHRSELLNHRVMIHSVQPAR